MRLEAQALGVELEERDARADADHRAVLVEACAGGRSLCSGSTTTTPTRMGESVDIIAYLRERFGTGAPVRRGGG
ncbi:MAG: hypothetical protein R3B82_19780 [Sandaracinaceae bacterium]